ncbi:uncharacterized protein DFL_006417 [Arthrobotrys flagrans]|uniref:Granulins domain-containing protein n=1 Tax=Arthrobotrys flagrans TaxID=97331 RepID=A0A437A136_ARTFL|nr:hypothetical protein DFL_006417 [Arthrobotrys flagrans]
MRIPSLSISLLSIFLLPATLADYVSYEIEPGKLLANLPGELAPSKSDVLKRSFLPLQEKRPLPRWIPRSMDNKLRLRQVSALGSGAEGLICTTDGPSCGPNAFCNSGLGCCLRGQTGCAGNSCCSAGQTCCTAGGGCCPDGYNCVQIRGNSGCCLEGTDCEGSGDLVNTVEGIANANDDTPCINEGFGVCPSRAFCCPAGRKCLRNADGKAACERVCEDANFFVCPSNDFCCPKGSSCFVDKSGRSRCKVTIVTTITASSDPPVTTTSVMNSSSTDMKFTTTSSSNAPETTSVEDSPTVSSTESPTETTSTIDPTNSTIETTSSPDPTETSVEASSSTTETAEAVSSTPAGGDGQGNNNNNGPLPPPNGGLDNIFTNEGERAHKISLPGLIGVGLGFFGFVIGIL